MFFEKILWEKAKYGKFSTKSDKFSEMGKISNRGKCIIADAVACDFVEAEAGRRQVERYTGMEKNSYGKKETMKRVSQ